MAVKIRLTRIGAKKAPIYRVVVTASNKPRNGRAIEMLGRYNPRTNPVLLELNKERVAYWLSVGAIPTDVMMRLLSFAGLVEKPVPPVKKIKQEDVPAKKEETPKAETVAKPAEAVEVVATEVVADTAEVASEAEIVEEVVSEEEVVNESVIADVADESLESPAEEVIAETPADDAEVPA